VRGTLGTGGMAVVYEAEDAILGRRVALKTIHRRYAEEASFRSRFEHEARVMASLDHENIVKVYDISKDGEVPFIVAERIDGQDVGDMLRDAPGGRLSQRLTRNIVAQLLRALAYAHLRGVIHRDVKPSNILITEEGTVKVADFGIARVVEDKEVGEPGEVIGSARYMSPEQLKGEETTPQSDLYSVGILLYHCLTGRPPFSGDAESVARQQIRTNPPLPRSLNKEISPHLEAVILKALAKDPEERYPSASAMLEALRSDAAMTVPIRTVALHERRTGRRHTRRRREGRRMLLVSSMLALLILGGGTAMAGLGYVGLEGLPLSEQNEDALTPAQPVVGDPTEAPAAPRGGPERPSEAPTAAREPEPTPEAPQATALVPVPSVDSYFDYFAVDTLANSGFRPQVVYGYREGYATKGVTWGTDPAVGTLMAPGSVVTVYATPKDGPQIPQPQIPQPQIPQPQAVRG
jgi:eukaryotic-like serine/threonine-protein kinase